MQVPSYGCGSAGRNCDWKGFAGGVTVGAGCFTCTDIGRALRVVLQWELVVLHVQIWKSYLMLGSSI